MSSRVVDSFVVCVAGLTGQFRPTGHCNAPAAPGKVQDRLCQSERPLSSLRSPVNRTMRGGDAAPTPLSRLRPTARSPKYPIWVLARPLSLLSVCCVPFITLLLLFCPLFVVCCCLFAVICVHLCLSVVSLLLFHRLFVSPCPDTPPSCEKAPRRLQFWRWQGAKIQSHDQ